MTESVTEQRQGPAWVPIWTAIVVVALGLFLYAAIFIYGPTVNFVAVNLPQGLMESADVTAGDGVIAELEGELNAAVPDRWTLWISALTLVVSIIGLISSTFLSWRQQARQARMDRLEAEHMRVEVEKMLLEIRQLQRELGG